MFVSTISIGIQGLRLNVEVQGEGNFDAQVNNTVILTQVNCNFTDMLLNWARSLRDVGHHHPLIQADDAAAHSQLEQLFPGSVCLSEFINSTRAPAADCKHFSLDDYARIVKFRGRYIAHQLKKGHHVLYSDVDIVFQHDPFKYFQDDFDVYIAMDGPNYMCTGFMYVKANAQTIGLMEEWTSSLLANPGWNQPRFNQLLKSKYQNVRVKRLDQKLFPSTDDYDRLDNDARGNAVLVHANKLPHPDRHEIKHSWLQSRGLWNPDTPPLNNNGPSHDDVDQSRCE